MKTLKIFSAFLMISANLGSSSLAGVSRTETFRLIVTIPESTSLKAISSTSISELKQSDSHQTLIERTTRDDQPVIIKTVVVR